MRKQPAQQRSREMVEKLLDAASRVIAEQGLEAATTNHMAEAAGVSVGSLYQYFASKDAVVEALLERFARQLLPVVDARLRLLLDASPRRLSQGILEAVFEVVEQDACHRELASHWQRLRTRGSFGILEAHMLEACRRYLLRHHARYQLPNLPAALFVAVNATLYTVAHYLALENPPVSRQELIAGLSQMLSAYLTAGAVDA